IESLVQQAVGYDATRGDMVTVVNAPFARDAMEEPEGPPFWQNPRTKELLRIALGGLAVLALIFTVLRPAMRQLMGPVKPRTAVATLVEDEEDVPVMLSTTPRAPAQLSGEVQELAMNFDEKRSEERR